SWIGSHSIERRLRHTPQQHHRVVSRLAPERRIQPAEQGADDRLPTPNDVVSQLRHPGKGPRQRRSDEELTNRSDLKWHLARRETQSLQDSARERRGKSTVAPPPPARG